MLARARQILDTDEALRARLQSLLQTEMVSKTEFQQETQRLWGEIRIDRGRAVSPTTRSAVSPSTRTAVSPARKVLSPAHSEVKIDRGRGFSASRSLMSPVQFDVACARGASPSRLAMPPLQVSPNVSVGSIRSSLPITSERPTSPLRCVQSSQMFLPSSTSLQGSTTLKSSTAALQSPLSTPFSPGTFTAPLSARSTRTSDLSA